MLVIKSSAGLARRNFASSAPVLFSSMISLLVSWARSSSVLYSSSLSPNSFSAAYVTAGRSAFGTPSISMIVSIGSRAEQASTKSMSAARSRSSPMPTALLWISSSIWRTFRGVNAELIRRRYLVVLRRIHRQEKRWELQDLGGHRIEGHALRPREQLGVLADV